MNIGAGTITANYDGAQKHATTIGDGAFIGSDTMLVAPVRIGAAPARAPAPSSRATCRDGMLAVGAPARIRARATMRRRPAKARRRLRAD